MRIRWGLPTALALLATGGCMGDAPSPEARDGRSGAQADPPAVTVVDARGAAVTFPALPTRIVSLVPSFTEILVEIGARDRLVARTEYDTLPVLGELPSVGTGLQPSLERVVALEPDLVLGFHGETTSRLAEQLARLEIPYLAFRSDGIEDVLTCVREFSRLTGRTEAGQSLLGRITETLDSLRTANQGAEPVRAALVLGGDPPWVAGGGTYLDDLLSLGGGVNPFYEQVQGYQPVSLEAFLTAGVDLILAMPNASLPAALEGIPVLRLPAGIDIPGPNLGAGAAAISDLLGRHRGS